MRQQSIGASWTHLTGAPRVLTPKHGHAMFDPLIQLVERNVEVSVFVGSNRLEPKKKLKEVPAPNAAPNPLWHHHRQCQGKDNASHSILREMCIGTNHKLRRLMGELLHHNCRTFSRLASPVLLVVAAKSAAAANFPLQARGASQNETSG